MTDKEVVKEIQAAVGKIVPFADVNGNQGPQQIACNQVRRIAKGVLDQSDFLGVIKMVNLESWTSELEGRVRTVWSGRVVIKTFLIANPVMKIPFTTKVFYGE